MCRYAAGGDLPQSEEASTEVMSERLTQEELTRERRGESIAEAKRAYRSEVGKAWGADRTRSCVAAAETAGPV